MTALCAVVLATRLLVPTGFMPVQTPHGLIAKMCGGMNDGATIFLSLPTANDEGHPNDRQPEQKPCAFAALVAPALLQDPAPLRAGPVRLLHELVLPPPAALALLEDDFRLPPLRGPPARA